MRRYKNLIVMPVIVIAISLYLIGVNVINRIDTVSDIESALPAESVSNETKTEEKEDVELEIIGDRVNINTATKSELMTLDGIGEKMAERIIKKREELGGFVAVEQIREVEGIGQKTYGDIKDYIRVE